MTSGRVTRDQAALNKEGIAEEWGDDGLDKTASKRSGYPVQAHHCISCSVMQKNNNTKMAKLAIDSGYDINNGKNNIFLPAKFGHMKRDSKQRHRGGHAQAYYNFVDGKLNAIYKVVKDMKPCQKPADKQAILDALTNLQKTIYAKLKDREVWLYDWSERLYDEDYREEGSGALTSPNQQSSSTAGLAWADAYPKGSARRKLEPDGKTLRSKWYKSRGFPVPGGKTT